jgi:glycosyltransferase involved in cell wall biosynthesis
MRLMITTALYPPAAGGAAIYFGGLAPLLAERPEIERLVVLTERLPGQQRRETIDGVLVLRRLPARVALPRCTWLGHAASYLLTQLRFAFFLPRLVSEYGVELLHFHTRFRGRLFYSALRRSGVPIVADLRDKMTDPARLVGVADRLLCCSEAVRGFAVRGGFPADRTSLIPAGFWQPSVRPPERVAAARRRYRLGDGPYVLFLGDVTAAKGVYELLEAYARWRKAHPDTQLVFAGVDWEGSNYLNRVAAVDGASYVGSVPHADALALIQGAEIVALPSRSEALGVVILEAVALGRKVICPPAVPEFAEHLGPFVLSEVSAEAIEEKLEAVWQSELRPRYPLSRHAMPLVAGALMRLYAETLG